MQVILLSTVRQVLNALYYMVIVMCACISMAIYRRVSMLSVTVTVALKIVFNLAI